MKFKTFNYLIADCEIFLLPSISFEWNSPYFKVETFAINFHFLNFHCKWLWVKTDVDKC